MTNNNLILKHNNFLNYDMNFELNNRDNLYEIISNSENNELYAIITTTIFSNNKKFNDIYLIYLLNLKTFLITDISVSQYRFKSQDVKLMVKRSELPINSTIITSCASPFSTIVLNEFFLENKYTHIFYTKKHFTPMIDYSRNFFQGIIFIKLINQYKITYKTVKDLAIT